MPLSEADQVRRLVEKAKLPCAYAGDDPDPVCLWLDHAPNFREVQWAMNEGFCPLCFWSLVRFFGVDDLSDVRR